MAPLTEEPLGTFLQLVTTVGAVLIGAVGFGWVDTILRRAGSVTPAVSIGVESS